MSGLFSTLKDFKKTRLLLSKPSGAGALLTGIKSAVIVPIPGNDSIRLRWSLVQTLIEILWNPEAPLSVVTGAMISLLSMFVESPAALIQRVVDDPDINIKLVEVIYKPDTADLLTFASRGADLSKQAESYFRYALEESREFPGTYPFENPRGVPLNIDDPDEFVSALGSVLAQIWILLPKAVTAPDTAADSEGRRWTKYVQQRRVSSVYMFSKNWIDIVRFRMADSLSIRRFMVNLMIDTKHSPGAKPRIAELICDISNYIEETGLAGFMLTIKFGIETAYPALALREFSSELNTLQELMILYKELGEIAPYMILLEAPIQNKFSPGNYPLLFSYAMGVGVQLERSVGALNFNRPYLDYPYFRLGQEMVRRAAGTVSNLTADLIGLTIDDKEMLKDAIGVSNIQINEPAKVGQSSGISYMNTNRDSDLSKLQLNPPLQHASQTDRPPASTTSTNPAVDKSYIPHPRETNISAEPHTSSQGISYLQNLMKSLPLDNTRDHEREGAKPKYDDIRLVS
ncbi:nucleocapsid protein [Longquan Berylmys bowersi morbillivirus 1]|uniref:Nucleocapsid n=1 Tax=Longquan Berylmys bowersi morbillivirus 1 TaxID=2877504 RepID=A0AAE8XSC2_9MONO|nr:nucleocapsid protein [Longquan Berylmys bowersi morbillivirus 1]